MRTWLFLGAASFLFVPGCGSGAFTSGNGGSGTSTATSGTGTGTGGSTGTSSTTTSATATTTSTGPCPNELGAYTVTVAGLGCGDLVPTAPQCIQAGPTPCEVLLVSQGTAGEALNGDVDLDMNGNFTSGAVKEGSVQRTGCTGTWNAATSQLIVDCGGTGSSQSCIATLTRTGTTCQ
jgi:hypothetical protein